MTGLTIGIVISLLVLLALGAGLWWWFRKSSSNGPAIKVGDKVQTSLTVSNVPAVCAVGPTHLTFNGEVTGINGSLAMVRWDTMISPGCHGSPWMRGTNEAWNSSWLGSPGVPPSQLPQLSNPISISALVKL